MVFFTKHKGYDTKVHIEALTKFGAINEHQYSFTPVKNRYLTT